MLYGICASKDVKLSNISRALQDKIPLIKTEDRLSRNLAKKDYSEQIMDALLPVAAKKVEKNMVIAIDPGDVMKPYAQKMAYLCNIYDASQGEPAQGYHLCQVTAADLSHTKIIPLYCEGYSHLEPDFTGKTNRLLSIIRKVTQHIGKLGTWAIDREGDNNEIISFFTASELKFVTRLKLNRQLRVRRKNEKPMVVKAEDIEKYTDFNYTSRITKIEDGKETTISVKYGILPVALNFDQEEWFNLVVIQGFGKHPMLLLTNHEPDVKDANQVWSIVEMYLTRWKCDECYRYVKQSYNLEDFRVRGYNSIRNIVAMVHAVAYFTCAFLTLSGRLQIMVNRVFVLSKRFFGIPSFSHYAMADGICELLKKARTGIIEYAGKRGKTFPELQLNLIPL